MLASRLTLSLVLATGFALACSTNASKGTPLASDYCSELSSYVSRCNVTDPCTVASVPQCPALVASYSAEALATVTACLSGTTCGDAGTSPGSSCFQAKLATFTPTATQAKVAQDYCTACPSSTQTAAECATYFYSGEGVGASLLPFDDAIAAAVEAQCILADAGLACANVSVCIVGVIVDATPAEPAACTGGVSYADGG